MTAIEELASLLTARNSELLDTRTQLVQYRNELISLSKSLGCADNQAPTQRLQEVLQQLGFYQKELSALAQEKADLIVANETLNSNRNDLEKYRTFQAAVVDAINDDSLTISTTYEAISDKLNELFPK